MFRLSAWQNRISPLITAGKLGKTVASADFVSEAAGVVVSMVNLGVMGVASDAEPDTELGDAILPATADAATTSDF